MEEKLKAISYPFIASVLPEAEIKTKKTKAQSIASEQMEALSQFNKEQNELKIKLCIDWLLKIEFNGKHYCLFYLVVRHFGTDARTHVTA